MSLTALYQPSYDLNYWFDSSAKVEGWWDQEYSASGVAAVLIVAVQTLSNLYQTMRSSVGSRIWERLRPPSVLDFPHDMTMYGVDVNNPSVRRRFTG